MKEHQNLKYHQIVKKFSLVFPPEPWLEFNTD